MLNDKSTFDEQYTRGSKTTESTQSQRIEMPVSRKSSDVAETIDVTAGTLVQSTTNPDIETKIYGTGKPTRKIKRGKLID